MGNQGDLALPTFGLAPIWAPGALVSTHTIGSLLSFSSLASSSLSSSLESTSVLLPPLPDFPFFSELPSSSSSSPSPGVPGAEPVSFELLVMTPLLAGCDLALGLLLLLEDLLEVLPELEPPLSLDESAYEIILS